MVEVVAVVAVVAVVGRGAGSDGTGFLMVGRASDW
jgi:hypothetical protein